MYAIISTCGFNIIEVIHKTEVSDWVAGILLGLEISCELVDGLLGW